MKKYGVLTERNSFDKVASDRSLCPICMSKLDSSANVKACPVHGSQPFEGRGNEGHHSKESKGERGYSYDEY